MNPPHNLVGVLRDLPQSKQLAIIRDVTKIQKAQGRQAARDYILEQIQHITHTQPAPEPTNKPPTAQQSLEALGRITTKKCSRQQEKADSKAKQENQAEAPDTNRWQETVDELRTHLKEEDSCRFQTALDNTQAWSQQQTANLNFGRCKEAHIVFRALHHLGCADMDLKGQDYTKAFQSEFFCVAEAFYRLPHVTICKSTFYNYVKRFIEMDLLDTRGHNTSVQGATRKDGTVYAIKLQPERDGKAKLTYAALHHQYRNLEEDIAQGRTFFKLGRSNNGVKRLLDSLSGILRWTQSQCRFPETENPNPVYDCPSFSSSGLEAVLDVTKPDTGVMGERIQRAVEAVVRVYGDQHSRGFWWKCFHALALTAEGGGKDYSGPLHLALERERAGRAEGWVRNPSALFITRLKRSGVYRELFA